MRTFFFESKAQRQADNKGNKKREELSFTLLYGVPFA